MDGRKFSPVCWALDGLVGLVDPHLRMLAKWLDDGGPVLGAQSLILTDPEHSTLSRGEGCTEEQGGEAEVPVLCGEHAAGQAGRQLLPGGQRGSMCTSPIFSLVSFFGCAASWDSRASRFK